MVCLGNICRSPLAEGIMKSKIEKYKLNWAVDSAGTSSWHVGEKPDDRSIEVADQYSVNLREQKSRQFAPYDFEQYDRIYAMDAANYRDITGLALNEEETEKVRLILNEVYPGENRGVPDPYWDDNGFQKVFQMLDEACEQIVKNEKM